MASGLGDLHDVPHELEWLLRQVDAVLGIAVLEYTGEAGNRAADGHITIGAPDNVLRLLPEPALLGPAVALVPKEGAVKKAAPGVAAHKTGFEKQILWQLPDKGC